ncbi:hypothetical protein F2Q68_00042569 [Brassica cretica]|uniref:Uncharacterized protein n=1 Tax=Brassica cretica TaxID=69181 RepID=A0A8S9MH25_BRACR|nr:hypothetical protein F2Q68_00042569 [Brassica cretica]
MTNNSWWCRTVVGGVKTLFGDGWFAGNGSVVVGVKRRSSSLDRVSSASLGYDHIHEEGDKGSGAARISDPPPVR